MALRALASKIRIPATLRRSLASRPTAPPPQSTVGIAVTTPKSAAPGLSPMDKMLIEQQLLAYEKKLTRDLWIGHFVGTVLGVSGASFILYCMFTIDNIDDIDA